ncbi:hypothetical protein [Sorangium cellulosum]|uniref:hypothetical protein n=1 Tax=Sorangium cellulosum TaxID=56 RepID=UPI001F182546|nr:hypothetical protein [Sorangium cellulosum]
MPRGIRAMNEWTATLARGQGNDRHTQVCGSYFTCAPVAPNSDDPFSFDQATKFNAKPTGPSLDHGIAARASSTSSRMICRRSSGSTSTGPSLDHGIAARASSTSSRMICRRSSGST